MGALKGSISVRRYIVLDPLPADPRRRFLKGLRAHGFAPIDPKSDLERSVGWVSILDSDDADLHPEKIFFVASGGEQLRASVRVDVLKPSSSEIRRQAGTRALAHEAKEGRPLAKRERAALKIAVARELRLRTLPRVRTFDVVWHLDSGRLYFWSQSKAHNESLLDLFVKTFALRLEPEGAARWALAAVGQKALAKLEPTPELWQGFGGVRPLGGATRDAA